jgi:ribose 5-phosphate isomerase A
LNVDLGKLLRLKRQLAESSSLGLGSGRAVADFVAALASEPSLVKRLTVYPSSRQIHLAALSAGLRLAPLDFVEDLDTVVDGADQIDSRRRIVKGGGGALLNEKILWEAAKAIFVIAGEEKFVKDISCPVPVEVIPAAVRLVVRKLSRLGGRAEVRILERGFPFLTERGNMLLDVRFRSLGDAEALERKVKAITGVVEVGLFNFPDVAIYMLKRDGVEEL